MAFSPFAMLAGLTPTLPKTLFPKVVGNIGRILQRTELDARQGFLSVAHVTKSFGSLAGLGVPLGLIGAWLGA